MTAPPARLFLAHTCPIRRDAVGCCACGPLDLTAVYFTPNLDLATPFPFLRRSWGILMSAIQYLLNVLTVPVARFKGLIHPHDRRFAAVV